MLFQLACGKKTLLVGSAFVDILDENTSYKEYFLSGHFNPQANSIAFASEPLQLGIFGIKKIPFYLDSSLI